QAQAFERSNEDPVARRDKWKEYLDLPMSIGSKEAARQRLKELESQIREQKRERDRAALERMAGDAAAKAAELKAGLKQFCAEFADTPGLDAFCRKIEEKVPALRAREAKEALDELARSENVAGARVEGDALRKHLEGLVTQADRLLKDYGDTPSAA